MVMPTTDLVPEPTQAGQEVVLWPWHLGHKIFVGIFFYIARPLTSNNTKTNKQAAPLDRLNCCEILHLAISGGKSL